jgi:hypothetical protein
MPATLMLMGFGVFAFVLGMRIFRWHEIRKRAGRKTPRRGFLLAMTVLPSEILLIL